MSASDDKPPSERAPARALEPGVVIDGRYRIVGPLGMGGMGAVLVAEHVELGRRVALKVLQDDVGADPAMRKRFEREAKTLAAMSHPNIVAINDYGVWEGRRYLVMELLEGRTLRGLLDEERPLARSRALGIAQQILRALAYAHERAVIHRDLKPGNVFLQALPDDLDHVKLLDFGFAKFVGPAATSMVTGDGVVVGTPNYMAPEQATPGELDHRADVYAAGVLLFEMIAGRRPFEERDALAVIRRRLAEDAPLLSTFAADVPPALDEIVRRALARRVEDRWPSAAEMARALAELPRDGAPAEAGSPAPPDPSSVSISLGELDAASAEPPRRAWRSEWIGLASVAALALAVLARELWRAPPAEPSAPPPSAASAPPDAGAPEPDAGSPPRDAGAADAAEREERAELPLDPWLRPAPPELLALRRRVLRGPPPSERDLQLVAAYARAHREDARATLLLGHGYARTGWPTGALDRYEEAYGIDPESRGDRDVLSTMIELCGSPSLGDRAADRIETIYGREALPAIEAALDDARGGARERLAALRDRLAESE